MKRKAEDWIKKHAKGVKVDIMDEDIVSEVHYRKLYEPSGGTLSGEGFCLFYVRTGSVGGPSNRGKLYRLSEELEKEIFDVSL